MPMGRWAWDDHLTINFHLSTNGLSCHIGISIGARPSHCLLARRPGDTRQNVAMTMEAQVPSVGLPGGGSMPLLGFGTWQIRGRRAYDAVRTALDAGYRHIDTATMYGNEAEVGRALRDSGLDRRDVFVTTKMPPSSAGQERATLTASLRALGTEHVDLWLVHWPPVARQLVPVWHEFLALRDEGAGRAVGVSNYSVAHIEFRIGAPGRGPAVNQTRWGPPLNDAGVVAASRG